MIEPACGLIVVDPELAYAGWAAHVEDCLRCSRVGELDLGFLCGRGQQLVEDWLRSEHIVSAGAV